MVMALEHGTGLDHWHVSTTDEGSMSFRREDDLSTFRLQYVDPPQSIELRETDADAVTRAIDTLRARAVADMERILGDLLEGLLSQLSQEEGRIAHIHAEVVTAPNHIPLAWLQEGRLTVELPSFRTVITDGDADGSDAFLARGYARSTINRRAAEIRELYEIAMHQLLSRLASKKEQEEPA